jgi:hypothetical protein
MLDFGGASRARTDDLIVANDALTLTAAGVPVVGTRIGAMPEIIRDQAGGRVLTPGSVRKRMRFSGSLPIQPVPWIRGAAPFPRRAPWTASPPFTHAFTAKYSRTPPSRPEEYSASLETSPSVPT